MKGKVIELRLVVRGGAAPRPANSAKWPRRTAAKIAAEHGLPTSVVVRVALGLGIGALAFEPDEVARIEVALGAGGPDEAA